MKDLFLENQICFPLYACSRTVTSLYRPILDKLGLTYPQYLVLLVLWKKDGYSVKENRKKIIFGFRNFDSFAETYGGFRAYP